MTRRSRALLALFVSALLLATAGGWLFMSEGGLQTAVTLARQLSGERLQITQASGRLSGPLQLAQVRWTDPALDLELRDLHIDWQPGALLSGTLRIDHLQLAELAIQTHSDGSAPTPPTDLRLPLAVDLPDVQIFRIRQGSATLVEALAGAVHSDGRQHRLQLLAAHSHQVDIRGEAQIDGQAPFPVNAHIDLAGTLEARPLAATLQATGPLTRLRAELHASRGIDGDAQALITPFAAMPFAEALINLRQLDPAAWIAGAPSAQLAITAQLQPEGEHITGSFGISNDRPGPLDRNALPLQTLAGQLIWQDEALRLPLLHAQLAGSGELSGSGSWQTTADEGLALSLAAQSVDASHLHSALRPTRLAGPLDARLSGARQQLRADLRDPRFGLLVDAQRQAAAVDLKSLAISAGDARLSLQGRLDEATLAFTVAGELARFDPARFARVPPARINAQLRGQGTLGSQPVIAAEFSLRDSVLGTLALNGEGRLQLAWPNVQAADLQLSLAGNRLDAHGAFGRPGDRLKIDIDAPRLAALGGEGGLAGQIELAGTLAQPTIDARLRAAQLGWPGRFSARDLTLAAQLAQGDDAPLHLDLHLQALTLPGHENAVRDLQVQGDGSRRQHRLRASLRSAEAGAVRLGLEGSWLASSWQGQLSELSAQDGPRSLQLQGSAPFRLSADAWQIGPLQLSGTPHDWQASLQASAEHGRLDARLRAGNGRMGEVSGELHAALNSPWAINPEAAWQGRLTPRLKSLDWLGPLLGDGITTGGQFNGQIEIAGTPASPRLSGRIEGQSLMVEDSDNGLQLREGTLIASVADNLLRIERGHFVNPHSPMPRPLRLAMAEAASDLQAPGSLEIAGQIRVDRVQLPDSAELNITLSRLGVSQLADQWVLASGTGRLQWQAGTLGLNGEMAVDAGYWQLAPAGAPRLSDDVLIRRSDQAEPPQRPRLSLDLRTAFGRNFLFSGAGLNTRLAGDIRLTASGRDLPRASGTIRTRDGRFSAYGQTLDIDRGVLTFQGLPDNPALDVRATRKGLSVEPGVQISGTARKPVVKLISDPELPDAEKLSWLILGHGPETLGAGDASVLLAAAGGLLGNDSVNLVQQLKQGFGLDELGVRQGALDGSGGRTPGSRVAGSNIDTTASTGNQILTIGKRLSSNALLSYEQSLGTAESIVKLSVALTRNISLIGRAGSDNAIDLLYTLTWGQPSRRSTAAADENAQSDRPRK